MRERGMAVTHKRISEETLLRLVQITLKAIHLVRSRMYIGMRESVAQTMIRTALVAAGLKDGVLFGGNSSQYRCSYQALM